MKIDKSEIAGKLAKIKGAISPKVSIECLKGVLFKDNTLTAYNLEIAISAALDTDTDETFIIPREAVELIEHLPNGEVDIFLEVGETDGEQKNALIIQTNSIRNKFSTFPAADFPDIPKVSMDGNVSIDGEELREAINSVLYAVSPTASKPALTGVLMECEGAYLNLVGCDGYRLAWARMKYENEFRMIVPRPTLQKILQIGLSGATEIVYSRQYAIFNMEGVTFRTRLLEGEFINYEKIVPKHSNSAIINRKDLIDSITRATICSTDKTSRVVLDLKDKNLTISAESTLGQYAEDIPLDEEVESPVRIAFNSRYLLDCIKAYQCENLECAFGSSLQPMVVDDGDLKSIVLPVRM